MHCANLVARTGIFEQIFSNVCPLFNDMYSQSFTRTPFADQKTPLSDTPALREVANLDMGGLV